MPAIKDRPGNARPVQHLLRRRVKALHQLDDNDIYETARASMALPVDKHSIAIAMFRMFADKSLSVWTGKQFCSQSY